MNASAASLSDRLTMTLEGLCRAVAARVAGGAMQVVMIVMVWRRVRRTLDRIQRLLTRFRAGRLWFRVSRPGRTGGGRSGTGALRMPRRFGWLLPMVPYEAASIASQLRVVLDDPEMAALLEAAPQARRVLAPLCRMLGIEAAGVVDRREVAAPPVVTKRVRRPRPKVDWGWIALPRGVLTWAKREGFGKVPRG